MCAVSMVFDHYKDPFQRWTVPQPSWIGNWTPKNPEVQELRALIAEFREAVAAARKVDVLTKQPDCEDPEKAKLERRVVELERRLDDIGRFGQTASGSIPGEP